MDKKQKPVTKDHYFRRCQHVNPETERAERRGMMRCTLNCEPGKDYCLLHVKEH